MPACAYRGNEANMNHMRLLGKFYKREMKTRQIYKARTHGKKFLFKNFKSDMSVICVGELD